MNNVELGDATVEQIADELARRYDAVVVLAEEPKYEGDKEKYFRSTHGLLPRLVGMTMLLLWSLKADHDRE